MTEEWYYCVDHDQVEPKLGCRMANRLGPYSTREEAEQALERVRKRNEEWEDDPAWDDEDWEDWSEEE